MLGDLLKTMRSSQIFSVCGTPEVRLRRVKGGKVAAAHRWVNAVNADGRHGVWAYELCSDPSEVTAALDRALRSVDRLSASK